MAGEHVCAWPASGAEQARNAEGSAMDWMFEITSKGDILDDGEIYALFDSDPEGSINDPIE